MTVAARPIDVSATYQNPESLAENVIRYFERSDGARFVVHYMHAGEDIGPNVYRCGDVDAARARWTALIAVMIKRGYTVRTAVRRRLDRRREEVL